MAAKKKRKEKKLLLGEFRFQISAIDSMLTSLKDLNNKKKSQYWS